MNNIDIKTIWTNNITNTEKEDFCYVVNIVFGGFCTDEHFKLKYIDNIYGPSVLIIVYIDHKPIGACSLWRNDLEEKEAYLAAEACVLPIYRGKGIYSAMLKVRNDIAAQRNNPLLYSFPNTNSFPRLLKKKWHVKLSRKVFYFPGLSSSQRICNIDKEYAKWWLIKCEGIYHIKRFGHHYLIKTVSAKGVGRVLGYIDEETALLFPKPKYFLWILYCESEKITFYNKHWTATPVVFINGDGSRIPFWKMDSL